MVCYKIDVTTILEPASQQDHVVNDEGKKMSVVSEWMKKE